MAINILTLRMKIHSIQYLRGIAALLVVYIHMTMFFFKTNFCGSIGVDLFFCISGFIITHSINKSEISINYALLFLKKRIMRVYPLYFLLTIFYSALLFLYKSQYSGGVVILHETLLSLCFIPSRLNGYNDPILFTGWSLIFEMFFYTIVTIIILIFKRNYEKILLLFFTSLSFIGLFINNNNIYIDFFISPLLFEFCYGILVYKFYNYLISYKNGELINKKVNYFFFFISFCLFVCVGFGKDYGYNIIGYPRELITFEFLNNKVLFSRAIVWGFPSCFLFFTTLLVFIDTKKINWLSYLGDISYSIYLVQVIVLFFYTKYLNLFIGNLFLNFLYMGIFFLLILVISAFTYELVEKNRFKIFVIK